MNTGIIKSISSFFDGDKKSLSSPARHLNVGDDAPSFTALNEHGVQISLSDFRGKKLALFFYPADNTPGCTAAACSLRDYYADLKAKGVEMLGVSPDSIKKHDNFIKKYSFPFSLIADEDLTIMRDYGVWGWKKFMGREYDGVHRTTFLIDENGKIQHIFDKVVTKTHAQQILEVIKG